MPKQPTPEHRPNRPKLSPEQADELRRAHVEGASIVELAHRYRINIGSASRIVRLQSHRPRSHHVVGVRVQASVLDEIASLQSTMGLTREEIVDQVFRLGLSALSPA